MIVRNSYYAFFFFLFSSFLVLVLALLYRSTLIEIVRRSSPNRDPDDLQTTNRCSIVVCSSHCPHVIVIHTCRM